ncbi:MAG: MBL fold metallo-hydrolase [Puniceicoccales bacterium]|jgi:glyoxylase-like metal-dependent hydrolase (beta-lactamase superfamily II)|nr:MBL fold metallo-hydrolase [Puniceicoccales bacterium]
MECHRFLCGPIANNGYLVLDPSSGDSVLIDGPVGICAAYEKFSQERPNRPVALLLTHGHWDHVAEAAQFQKKFSVPVYAHGGDLLLLQNPAAMSSFSVPGLEISPCEPDFLLTDGQRLALAGGEWIVRAIAGHTPGGVAYHLPAEGWLFSGDSLFRHAVGRSDLPGGDGLRLVAELRSRILTLPPTTRVLPGHGAETTVQEEILHNPFLKESP